jgi:6-phosphogluconolactonase
MSDETPGANHWEGLMYKLGFIAMLSLALAACATDGQDGEMGTPGENGENGTPGPAGPSGPAGPQLALPGVYTLANADGPNQVAGYIRATNGNLSRMGQFATGGEGVGQGIGSQGAIVFDAPSQRFFAVNPGDDSISMLAMDAGGNLTRLSRVQSGGIRPVSITVRGDMVYVANQGEVTATPVNANISGFQIQGNNLVPIAGSTRPLSATTDVRPTNIEFSPDGKFLVVTERFAHRLSTFAVIDRVAQPGNFQASAGMQPFAFDWSPEGALVVAEVGAGGPGGSSVSSYSISSTGTLTPITSALPTGQTAACWVVVAGGFAYVANTGSGTLTAVNVAESGQLSLRDASGVSATPGGSPADLTVTPDRGFLYALAGTPRAIHIYEIGSDGSLAPKAPLSIPSTSVGIVAR